MPERIRRIQEEDFEQISTLLKGDNSVDKLEWLFRNPYKSGAYNGYVGIDEEQNILGVIGFTKSTYYRNNEEFEVCVPMSWMIKPDYKGLLGVSLFKKATSTSNHNIVIGGSEISRKLYRLFNYERFINVKEYIRIIKPFQYFKRLKKRNLIKKIGVFTLLLLGRLRRPKKGYKKISLEEYDGNNFLENKRCKDIFQKSITKKYIDWLVSCPNLKTYAFAITYDSQELGMGVVNIKEKNDVKIGRIVHLPFLAKEDKKLWYSVLNELVTFLKSKNCCSVSCLGLNKNCQEALEDVGFKTIKRQVEPVYLKKNDGLLSSNTLEDWHLQFSEGDIFTIKF